MKILGRLTAALGLAISAVSLQAFAAPLTIINTYADKDVWITTYQSGRTFKLQSFCVPRGKTVTQNHEQYVNGFNVRAEVTGGANCAQPVICDTDMGLDGKGDLNYRDPARGIYVHQHARNKNACYISWRSTPDVHRAVVQNMYKDKAVWVTFYDYLHQKTGTQIIEKGCVPAGQTKTYYHDWFQGGAYKIRAEVMTGSDCKGTKVCDTDANPMMAAGGVDNPVANRVYPKANGCYIDWK